MSFWLLIEDRQKRELTDGISDADQPEHSNCFTVAIKTIIITVLTTLKRCDGRVSRAKNPFTHMKRNYGQTAPHTWTAYVRQWCVAIYCISWNIHSSDRPHHISSMRWTQPALRPWESSQCNSIKIPVINNTMGSRFWRSLLVLGQVRVLREEKKSQGKHMVCKVTLQVL